MECPNCKQSMKIDGEPTTTYNKIWKRGRHGEYERTNSVCEKCDIWLAVEIPIQKTETAFFGAI